MALTLGDDDRRAIDLLMDHSPEHFQDSERGHVHSSSFAAAVDTDFDGRIGQVERILKLLAQMPEPEVPDHLLARTLSFIDTSNPNSARITPREGMAVDDRPVA